MTKCYICGEEFDSADMEKDHVPPTCFFPDNKKPDNLFSVKCCKSCHDKFDVIDERMRNVISVLSGSKSGEVGMRSLRVFKRSPKLLNQFMTQRKEHPTLEYNDGSPKAFYYFDDYELDLWLSRIVRGLYYKKYRVILSPNQDFVIEKLPGVTPPSSMSFEMQEGLEMRPYFVYGLIQEDRSDYWLLIFYDQIAFMVSVDNVNSSAT